LTVLLLVVELYDELHSGVFSVGSAAIQESLGVGAQELMAMLLVAPFALGTLIEPWLFLLADRHPQARRWFIAGGLAVMALASVACALAPSPWWFAVAVAVSGIANACGVELAQATLIDAHPAARERTMARWVLFGAIGDLLAPVLLAALAFTGLGWRTGFLMMAVVLGGWAVLVARAPFPGAAAAGDDDGGGEPEGLLVGLRLALGNRRLLGWMVACWACDLLDEVLVILASVHLRDHLGATAVERSVVLGAGVAGGLGGLWLLDRALGVRPARSILIASTVACLGCYVMWMAAPVVWLSAVMFALVGVTVSPLYPLTMAQCYAALPGRSGALHAASRITTPLVLGTPWLLGWLGDTCGTVVALAAVTAAPLGILAVALFVPGERDPDIVDE
jgi:predicted MFS family arabinose efflux permease